MSYNDIDQLFEVRVSDTGSGLTPRELSKLFQLYGKVERNDKDVNEDGIGMGLVICKKIVENSGGQIQVYSEGENLGSTFTFTM